MKKLIYLLFFSALFFACKSSSKTTMSSGGALDYGSPNVKQTLLDENTFVIKKMAQDPKYGYSKEYPIMVGKEGSGPENERRFLNALAGPNGEEISYNRKGSCCHFKTKNGLFGPTGLLDIYIINYEGLKKPIELYLNMYDSDELQVPVGFTLKK